MSSFESYELPNTIGRVEVDPAALHRGRVMVVALSEEASIDCTLTYVSQNMH
jgi:hypothetical protein